MNLFVCGIFFFFLMLNRVDCQLSERRSKQVRSISFIVSLSKKSRLKKKRIFLQNLHSVSCCPIKKSSS